MRADILRSLQQEILCRCEQPANRFGMGVYWHIEAVVRNGALLAEQYGADQEVVMIAAWLHDVASITDFSLYSEHHLYGAEMAREILVRLGYEEEKICLVQRCIRNHRGSVRLERENAEELCVADADAAAHFDSVPSLLHLACREQGMVFEEGRKFVKAKLERSFQKLSPQGKDFFQNKYRQAVDVLDGMTEGEWAYDPGH